MNLYKKIKINVTKIVLIQIFMCFVALALWGHWMVNFITIISPHELFHVLTAPGTILITTASFCINIILIRKKIEAIKNYYMNQNQENHARAQDSIASTSNSLLVTLIFFNIIGPFISMSMLYYPSLGFFISSRIDNPLIVYVGAITATGMSFLFFVPFINWSKQCIEDIGNEVPMEENIKIFNFYQHVARVNFVSSIGIVMLVGATILSVIISNSNNSPNLSTELVNKALFISFVVISGIVNNYLSFYGQRKKMGIQ